MTKEKRKTKSIITLIFFSLLLTVIITGGVNAEKMNQIMGSFQVDLPSSVNVRQDEYVPMGEVADTMDVDLEWRLEQGRIEGYFSNTYFRSDVFIIANGNLYLPVHFYADNFDLFIEVRGDNFYIYKRIERPRTNLELVLNTNKGNYRRNEELAVSILLMNNSDRDATLRYPSSKEYDLVLTRFNREVWRKSSQRGHLTIIRDVTIPANDFKLYTALINPSEDTNIYFGTYELHAEISTTSGSTIKSDPIQIRIQ
ncbi:BsuPI-related putative proteinase inhibitor [Natronospora cellulosivora (SeqCode)]